MDWGLAKVLKRGGIADEPEAPEPVASVIRTVRSGSEGDDSQAGSVLGTPAYMAPEQAGGDVERVDRRADVFGLGSILCEVLTGQPAYTGRSKAEVMRKAMRGDTGDAWARLDGCGADGELIALARDCLAVEAEDRPRDAGVVAGGIAGYLAEVQERLREAELARAAESARAEEAQARAVVERSRRRRTMALAASMLAMITMGGLTFAYLAHERQARAAAGERLVGRATTLLEEARGQPDDPARWRTALSAVQQAEDDSAGMAPDARDRLALLKDDAIVGLRDAERDATLRQTLVEVRADRQDAGAEATDAAYAAAFRAAELDVDALDMVEAGARLRRRPAAVIVEVAAYLDHWSGVRREAKRQAASWRKPLDVARAADADDYRGQLRALVTADDRKPQAARLRALAEEPKAGELPAPTAVLLAGALENADDRDAAIGLLRRAQAEHPGDVWINYNLARLLEQLHPPRTEEV
jgi:serine/threonine-protein kinase